MMVPGHGLACRWFSVATKNLVLPEFPQVSDRFESSGHVTSALSLRGLRLQKVRTGQISEPAPYCQ